MFYSRPINTPSHMKKKNPHKMSEIINTDFWNQNVQVGIYILFCLIQNMTKGHMQLIPHTSRLIWRPCLSNENKQLAILAKPDIYRMTYHFWPITEIFDLNVLCIVHYQLHNASILSGLEKAFAFRCLSFNGVCL